MCNLKIHFSPSFQPIWHCTAGVDVIDGVVQAIGIQVDAADRFGVKAAHKIFVQEAARLGIVVAAVQVVKPDGSIVIIPAVAEGAPKKHIAFRIIQQIPPRVATLLTNERADCIINTRHVALQVLAEDILLSVVLKPRNAALVVEIPLDLPVRFFVDDALAVHTVCRRNAGSTLPHTDAVRVVGKRPRHTGRRQRRARFQQPPARPRQRLPAVRRRVPVRIVHAALAVIARHAPVLIAIRHRLVGRYAAQRGNAVVVLFFRRNIPGCIIGICHRLVIIHIFPRQAIHAVIGISPKVGAGAMDNVFDEAIPVVVIAVPTVILIGDSVFQRARIAAVRRILV